MTIGPDEESCGDAPRHAKRLGREVAMQYLFGCELRGELRCAQPFPYRYELKEENHRFCKEDGVWYRRSQVYRLVYDAATGAQLRKELLLDNRSRVMYDPALIPPDQIKDS